jgi:CheY-like chemotaxis protein
MIPEAPSGPAILVVDDDEFTRNLVIQELREAGYVAVGAPDGQKGLIRLYTDQAWGESGLPDLIISDIMMPQMNGFTFCEKVKSFPQARPIPFLFLTSKGDALSRAHGLLLGCRHYLNKSEIRKHLLRVVSDCLLDAESLRSLLAEHDPVMEGTLPSQAIQDLVDMFLAGTWTGRLELACKGTFGTIQFKNGAITGVKWGQEEGEGALARILELKEGSFRLERKPGK